MKVTRILESASSLTFDLYRSINVCDTDVYDNVSDRFIIITNNNDTMFVPSMCVKDVVQNLITTVPVDDIVYPLEQVSCTYEARSFDHLFLRFANNLSGNIICVKLKGTTYYGGNGIITDENYTPLVAMGFEIKIVHTEASETYKHLGAVCYINPSVFISKDPVSKGIVTRLIPYLTQHRLDRFCYDCNRYYCERKDVRIIVSSDITKLMYKVNAPYDRKYTESDIYDILDYNMRYITI